MAVGSHATTAASYDAVPYPGQPYARTHPGWLAGVARLLGVGAPPPDRCRVLELGCCDGGNLVPMAAALPGATFVGVDYSPVQLDAGRRAVARLGLANIDLRPVSILDITPGVTAEWGTFDYVLCHGVFSWVPPPVQDKILAVCAAHLAPQGVAYVSYNAMPGWHLRGIIRDMMRYHALRFAEPARQIQEARLILDFVARHAAAGNAQAYATALREEVELMQQAPDHYLFHEHLEDHCEPFYFHEFVRRARGHGLDYFAESRLGVMAPSNFGPAAERALSAIATDVVELEQFMDFLRNRTFRETLLRRADAPPADFDIAPERLTGLYVTGDARPQAPSVDLRADVAVTFDTRAKVPLTATDPLLKAALLCLANAFPAAVPFDDLAALARAQLRTVNVPLGDAAAAPAKLGRALLKLLTTTDAVEVSLVPGRFTTTPGERPRASPIARLQAETGAAVTSGRHDTVVLREGEPELLRMLDGTRTPADIAAASGRPEEDVRRAVGHLGRCALIVG